MDVKEFVSVEEFAEHTEKLGQDLLAAGYALEGSELIVRSRAYEVPKTGYYGEIYLDIQRIINLNQKTLSPELKERLTLKYVSLHKMYNS